MKIIKFEDISNVIPTIPNINHHFNIEYNVGETSVDLMRYDYFMSQFDYKYGDMFFFVGNDNPVIASNEFLRLWDQFINSHRTAYNRIARALTEDYNPIENYDGYEVTTFKKEGTETSGTTYDGSEKNESIRDGRDTYTTLKLGSESQTTTKSGAETDTTTYSGTETDTTTYTGTETDTTLYSGQETVGHSKTAHLDTDEHGTFPFNETGSTPTLESVNRHNYGAQSDTDTKSFTARSDTDTKTFDSRSDTDTKSFNDRTDTSTVSFTDRSDQTVLEFNDRSDSNTMEYDSSTTDTKSFENRTDTTTLSFEDRMDTTEMHKHGNMGVTKSQDLILSEAEMRRSLIIMDMIIDDFVKMYFFYI